MNGESLLANFETLASAPGGVGRLRELILQLAIQGRLVPQDSDDEPANVLLTRAKSIRAVLVERGEAKKAQSVSTESRNATPHKLPSGWSWASMEDLTSKLGAGSTPLGGKETYVASGVKFLRSQNVWNDGLRLDGVAFIDGGTHDRMSGTCVKPKDVLLNITGASIGRSAIVSDDFDEGNVSQHVAIVRPVMDELRGYLHKFLISPSAQGRIMDVQVGISREGLSMDRLRRFPVPLPPLAEQQRIVAKVDELMALCDELEARQEQRHAVRRSLQTSALEALSSADSPDVLAEAWNRVRANWDALTARPDSIPPLRQAILDLAVQGKLLPQDPSDEPASKLIETIALDRLRLVREGKLRRQLDDGLEPQHRHDVPAGWVWCRLAELFAIVTDGDHQPPPRSDVGIPFLVIGNVSSGSLDLRETRLVPEAYYEGLDWSRKPKRGDILYTVTGSFGMPILVDVEQPFCVQRHIAILKATRSTPTEFLRYVLQSPLVLEQATACATGTAQKTVPLRGLRALAIPLPPLAEQRRIVAKAEELMALCGELESWLQAEQETSGRFASASARSVTV